MYARARAHTHTQPSLLLAVCLSPAPSLSLPSSLSPFLSHHLIHYTRKPCTYPRRISTVLPPMPYRLKAYLPPPLPLHRGYFPFAYKGARTRAHTWGAYGKRKAYGKREALPEKAQVLATPYV